MLYFFFYFSGLGQRSGNLSWRSPLTPLSPPFPRCSRIGYQSHFQLRYLLFPCLCLCLLGVVSQQLGFSVDFWRLFLNRKSAWGRKSFSLSGSFHIRCCSVSPGPSSKWSPSPTFPLSASLCLLMGTGFATSIIRLAGRQDGCWEGQVPSPTSQVTVPQPDSCRLPYGQYLKKEQHLFHCCVMAV